MEKEGSLVLAIIAAIHPILATTMATATVIARAVMIVAYLDTITGGVPVLKIQSQVFTIVPVSERLCDKYPKSKW